MIAGLASQNEPELETTLRKGEVADAARMNVLLQNHYNWINVNYSPFSVVQRKSSLRNLEDAVSEFPSLVAVVDDVIVGFTITFPQEPSLMQIRLMYVDDAYRSNGIATLMVNEIEGQIMAGGYGMVMATSSTHWYPNKVLPTKVFERNGYEVTSLGSHTEMYMKRLGETQPLLAVAEPDQLFGIRRIGFPERDA